MPASFKSLFVSDQSMSLPCGFGMEIVKSPFRISACRLPGNGPSKPKARSRRTSSRRLIGLGILWLRVDVDAVNNREMIAVARFKENPIFQNTLQLFSALFQGRAFCPRARTNRNLPKEAAVFHQFIFC